jgi:LEA14-like dessication related protein
MKRPLLWLVLPLFLSNCLGYKEVSLQEVQAVSLQQLDPDGIWFTVDAVIENPNGYRIKARDPDVDLFVNGSSIGKARIDSVITLEKHSTQLYSIPVHVAVSDKQMTAILLASAFSGKATLGAKGTLVGQAGPLKRRFPFEVEHMLEFER